MLVHAAGRSYGDVALNNGGVTVLTSRLDRIRAFDRESGVIVCEPGVTFNDLHREFLPEGFTVAVTPGTGFATIGGAVANDVHGKNHDRHGSFGDHVLWIELLLPSGEHVRVSSKERPEVFAATIGGIGLTGIILSVCFRMRRVPSNAVELSEERIGNLDAFFERFEQVRASATYSIGWIDALARGRKLGRGVLETAESASVGLGQRPRKPVSIPFDCPGFMLNAGSVGLFNELYYRRIRARGRRRRIARDRFLYPLDALAGWNKLYGSRGFYQFQCVLPDSTARAGIQKLLETVSRTRRASFLTTLKTLGGEGRGHLSFPLRGYTLALDFPSAPGIRDLMGQLENLTLDHGGRVYLAKDACLSADTFERMYPKLEKFRCVLEDLDPRGRMSSDMARRLQIRKH